jgi:hypothetical protein
MTHNATPRSGLSPDSYLIPLTTAARELGLEVAELLEWAEEFDLVGAPLRVCVRIPDDANIEPRLDEHDNELTVEEPLGLKPADRRYAFIYVPNNPGFFRDLAQGEAPLGSGDWLHLVDGSGVVWAGGVTVRLEGLLVPREDVEKIRATSGAELGEKEKATLLKIIGAMAKLLAKTEPAFGSEPDPNVKLIAADLADISGLSKGTLENKVNDGLRELIATGEKSQRKRGKKKGENS